MKKLLWIIIGLLGVGCLLLLRFDPLNVFDPTHAQIWRLSDPNEVVRENAARRLASGRDQRAVEPLLDVALNDKSRSVRAAAAESLSKLGYQPTGDEQRALLWVLMGKYDEAVQLGAPAVAPLAYAFADGDTTALYALAKIPDPRTLDSFVTAAGDEDQSVRTFAVEQLARFEDPRVPVLLIAALRDNSRPVRESAAKALAQAQDPRAIRPLIDTLKRSAGMSEATAVAQALFAMGPDALETLEHSLKTDPWPQHEATIRALGWTRDEHSLELLVAVAPSMSMDVRRAAVQAMAHLAGSTDPLPGAWEATRKILLEEVSSEDDNRMGWAISVMIELGRPETVPQLKRILQERGNKSLATAYLNCGQPELAAAARVWAVNNGFDIKVEPVYGETGKWGSFGKSK